MTTDGPDRSEPVDPHHLGRPDDCAEPPGGPVFPGTPMHPSRSPRPGPPTSEWNRRARWAATAAAVIAVAAMCCLGGIAVVAVALTGGELNRGPAPPAEEGRQRTGLHAPVRDGRFEFVVHRIECGARSVGAARLSQTADGHYCLVHLSIRNIGDRPQMFSDVEQKAFGPDGVEYGADTEAGVLANRGADVHLKQVNPGNGFNGVIVFDIPQAGEITRLQLHESLFSSGVEVILD